VNLDLAKKDFYEVLKLNREASDDEIKKSYRKLAKEYHPDMNPGNPKAEAKFKEINEAYETLSNPERKAQYDRFGHHDPSQGGFGGFDFGGFGQGGMGDIFDMFFGGGTGGSASRNRNAPTRGADFRYDLEISFDEAAFGCKREIDVNRTENCSECNGTGAKKGTQPKTCTVCGGRGEIQQAQNTAFGRFVNVRACETCRGEGKIITEPCERCRGKKKVRKVRKISVTIPPGIDNGQAITLRGEGDPGERGGPNGDLYVYIIVKPHKLFERKGYDIHCEVPITFVQATLGAEIEVPTLEGRIKYQIPEGTQPGTVFRIKNRGIQHLRDTVRGDQFVRVNIEVPKRLNQKQKELLVQFGDMTSGKEHHEQHKTFFDKMKDAFGM